MWKGVGEPAFALRQQSFPIRVLAFLMLILGSGWGSEASRRSRFAPPTTTYYQHDLGKCWESEARRSRFASPNTTFPDLNVDQLVV